MRVGTKKVWNERSGSTLVVAMLLIVGMVAMSYGLVQVATGSSDRQGGARDDEQAFYLAEAGLSEGFEARGSGLIGNVGSLNAPAYQGGGVLWVDATPLGNNRTRFVSTAMSGRGRVALEAVVEFDAGDAPLFIATLNSKETLTLNEGVMIDSYDSSKGTYLAQRVNNANGHDYANPNGHVRSNNDVILNANATVFGDATPGPSGSVTLSTGSLVVGATTPAPEPFTFPPVELPTYPPSPSIAVPENGAGAIPPGKYDMTGIAIGKAGTLKIVGPADIVVDDFLGGKDANLVIDATNGPVQITVRNSYMHTAGFEAAAVPGSPMALAFYMEPTQDVVFPSNTRIRGAYYAPNADIVFSNNNECWGAFAANRISMSNDMKFHFDEDLMNHFLDDDGKNGNDFEILSWGEVQVQPDALLSDRRPPLTILGVRKSDLLSPANSWDQTPAP
jgi:hypothetical protein